MSDNVIRLPHKQQRRLSLNINTQSEELLGEYMSRNGVGITEAIRRFVGVAGFIMRAIDSGDDVLIRRGNGQIERVVFDL